MENVKLILVFSMLCTLDFSCKTTTTDPTPTTPTAAVFCKLTQMVKNNGTNDFTYGAAGNITKYVNSATYGTDKFVSTSTQTYSSTGQLSSNLVIVAMNGKAQPQQNVSAYTYTNGLPTGITFTQIGNTSPFAGSALKYDANKRLTELVYTNNKYSSTEKYEYDAAGNCTRYVFTNTDGEKEEIVSTFDTSKNPEQIVAKGFPFDILFSKPWNVNMALTTKDTYDSGNGKPSITTAKRTNIKTDAKGYVISSTYADSDGTTVNETYTLADCN